MSSLLHFEKYAAAMESGEAETPQMPDQVTPAAPNSSGIGDVIKTLVTGGGNGFATGLRGLTGAGVGALAGKMFGGSAGKGALIGAGVGLLPDVIRHAPKLINFVRGLFTKQSSVVFHKYFEKQASMADMGQLALGMGMLQAANGGVGVNQADLNKIEVPDGALPPEPLLLPQVKREGTKASIKSILKNLGIGTAAGAGLGAIAKYLHDGNSSRDELIAAALGGGALGFGSGAVSSLWNTPDARLEAMLAKHNELHGKSAE